MNLIERARDFVKKLLSPIDTRHCPHCHSSMIKKFGFYPVTIRDVGGIHTEKVQRYWCHACRRTFSFPDPRREARSRYARQVQRKALDLYFHVGASLRHTAEWLRSEINGCTERALIWNPLLRQKTPPATPARLNHTTVWRWEQKAAQKVKAHCQQGALRGLIRFSGALVADASTTLIRGGAYPLHLIADAVTHVGLVVRRLRNETEQAIAGQFRLMLHWWGLLAEQVLVLISDGAASYRFVLDRVLRWAQQQRSLFHLWRNISPSLRTFAEGAAEEALDILLDMVHAVWDASSLAEAEEAFSALWRVWSHLPLLQPVLRLIGQTLQEVMLYTSRVVEGIGRTSNVAERFFRRYKQRVRRMGCFMSLPGCDAFNFLWLIYINLEPYQQRREQKRHYRYPGLCPLQVAGVDTQGISWLDAVGL